jgi:hypothetical protein
VRGSGRLRPMRPEGTVRDIAGPGRGLRETPAEHHDPFEKSRPPHNWRMEYDAYSHAPVRTGSTPDEALRRCSPVTVTAS